MLNTLVLSALVAAAPAPAQTAAPQQEVPLAVQVAREVLTPELWNRTLDEVVPTAVEQIQAMVAQAGGTVDDGLGAEIRKIYDRAIPYAFVADLQASLLQKNFTPAELVELRDFYRTPLGRKMRDRMPVVTADATAAAMEKVQSMASEFEALAPFIHVPQQGGAEPTPVTAK
jgi:uncharacterized protein